MFKKICKAIIVIPLYLFLLLEGWFGGYASGKYRDPWNKIKRWMNEF